MPLSLPLRHGVWALTGAALLGFAASSCTTTRAIYTNESTSTQHGIQVLQAEPISRLQKSAFTKAMPLTVIAGGAVTGGVLGLEVENSQTKVKENSKLAGALGGFVVGYLVGGLIRKVSQIKGAPDGQNYVDRSVGRGDIYGWLKKYNRRHDKMGLLGWTRSDKVELVAAGKYWDYVIADQRTTHPFVTLNAEHLAFLNHDNPQAPGDTRTQALLDRQLIGYRHLDPSGYRHPVLVRQDAQPEQISCTNRFMLGSYAMAFPSADPSDMIRLSVPKLDDEDLRYLLVTYPGSAATAERVVPEYLRRASMFYSVLSRYKESVELVKSPLSSATRKLVVDQAESLADARQVKILFPQEEALLNSVFNRLSEGLPRGQLPELIQVFPTATNVSAAQWRYLATSSTLNELTEAIGRYPKLTTAQTALVTTDVNRAEALDHWLQTEGNTLLGAVNAGMIRRELQLGLFSPKIDSVSADRDGLRGLKEHIAGTTWLIPDALDKLLARVEEFETDFRRLDEKKINELRQAEEEKLIAQQKAEKERKEEEKKLRIETNSNFLKWAKGDKICLEISNSILMGIIDDWNENKSKAKIKIIAGPKGNYEGELIQQGTYIWAATSGKGWHLCLDEEILTSVEKNQSNDITATSPKTKGLDDEMSFEMKVLAGKYAKLAGIQIMNKCKKSGIPNQLNAEIGDIKYMQEAGGGFMITTKYNWFDKDIVNRSINESFSGVLYIDQYGCNGAFVINSKSESDSFGRNGFSGSCVYPLPVDFKNKIEKLQPNGKWFLNVECVDK